MWFPVDLPASGPRYLALVRALEGDVVSGRVAPLTRLPPQRDLAFRLGLSVGTVTRVYTVAAQRGLVAGEVGRGTYIRADSLANRAEDGFFGDGSGTGRPIDLSLNVPPLGDEANRLASELRSLAGSPPVLDELLRYLPHQGLPRHRHAIACWIGRSGYSPAPSQVVLCNGAQHALSVVLAATCRSGDIVLAEALTYPGFKAAAAAAHIEVRGVATDSDGLLPDALDRACAETGARLLFTMPTLQNPIGSTMPPGRRADVAAILRHHGTTVLEDDVYGFLDPSAPSPLAALLPEQAFLIGSFSKSLAPGIRLGYVVAPVARVMDIIAGVRATAWMATPLMAEVVSRWVSDGTAVEIAAIKRTQAALRRQLAVRMLGEGRLAPVRGDACFHAWLRLDRSAAEFAASAAARGVAVTPQEAVATDIRVSPGVRLCLGAAGDEGRLQRGLEVLASLLENEAVNIVPSPSLV